MKENDKILNSSAGASHRKQASGRAQVRVGGPAGGPISVRRAGAPAHILSFFLSFCQFVGYLIISIAILNDKNQFIQKC